LNCLPPAIAQVRWDVGAEAGVMQRFTDRALGAPAPLPGPVGQVHAHVAVIPMLRLGVYLAHDISPAAGLPAREITEAGVRAKLSPPLFAAPWHAWAFLGAGYARTYEPSHPGAGVFVPGAEGGILDAPLGVALGYRLDRTWEPFVELGVRIAVATLNYSPRSCSCPGEYPGRDSVALSLSLGLNLNR
jgi:hypothetical protein